MEKLERLMLRVYLVTTIAARDFLEEERGDTNFVSMLLIIAIVIVLAGTFLVLGRGVMATVSQGIQDFFKELGLTWKEG